MRRGQWLGTVQGFMGVHRGFEEADFAAKARREADRQRLAMLTARPSVQLGHGRLGLLPDAATAGLLDPRGLFLGALGGELLFYSGEGHLLTYARTRGGKGRDVILPNLAHIRDRSVVVIDVKDGENAFASYEHRAETLGHTCVFLNPSELLGLPNTRINPLRMLVDIAASKGAIDTEASEIALILIPPPRGDQGDGGWPKQGARRLVALYAEYLALFEPEACTLSGLWRFVNSSEAALKVALIAMENCGHEGIAGRASAFRSVYETAEKQWEAYRSEAIEALEPFEPGKTLDRATAAHEFDFGRLKEEPCTVYLITPSEKLGVFAPWISLVINYLIEVIARRPGPVRTTFILDEFPQLPPAPAIKKALQLYSGKGIGLWLFSQSRYSLGMRWRKEDVQEFEDQDVFQTWAVEDPTLIRDITLWSGTRTISARGLTHGGGIVESAGANLGETSRPVLQTEDIREISSGRQILKMAGAPYLFLADRVPFFEVDPWKYQIRDLRNLHLGRAPR